MTATTLPTSRPWTQSYGTNVPHTLGAHTYGQETILDVLERHARECSSHPALRFKGRAISYGQLWREARRFARGLQRQGVVRGDTVALLLPNCPQFIVAEVAIWMLGGIVAPTNPLYPAEELAAILRRMGASRAVVGSMFYDTVKGIQGDTDLRQVIVTSMKDYLPAKLWAGFTFIDHVPLPWRAGRKAEGETRGQMLRAVAKGFRSYLATKDAPKGDTKAQVAAPAPGVPVFAWGKQEGHLVTVRPGDLRFRTVVRMGGLRGLRKRETIRATDQATLLPSGGTTGTPKGVMGTHGALVAAGRQLEAWLASALTPGQDEIMLPLPLFHVYGCLGVQGLTFVGGRTLSLIPNPRDIDDLVKTIETVRPTMLTAVPNLFKALLAHKRVASGAADFSSIRLCFSGAEALMADTRTRFEQLTGGTIIEGYSLTEGQMATLAGPVERATPVGSIGLPLPDVEVMLVDPEAGVTPMPEGQAGEIIIRAPQMMMGYRQQPTETAETVRTHPDGSTWLYTGDIARMDAEGFFYLVDRKKDLIKVSGFQVFPLEIERAISTHPAVAEVGVTGLKDPDRGEIAGAWIVVRPGMTPPTKGEIKTLCREHLAPYKVPGVVTFVEALPKSALGKILRRQLVGLGGKAGDA